MKRSNKFFNMLRSIVFVLSFLINLRLKHVTLVKKNFCSCIIFIKQEFLLLPNFRRDVIIFNQKFIIIKRTDNTFLISKAIALKIEI